MATTTDSSAGENAPHWPPELPGPRLPRPLREFLHTETAGGLALLTAAVLALLWANSPWSDSYEALWSTELRIEAGGFVLAEDLRHWVNDALMAIFFFVIGLEIKREMVVGELRQPRTAALPLIAAIGGMIVPALIFTAFNAGGEGANGWAIPTATDIAFALGVLALLGSRVPPALKLFLLTLAVADDMGAIAIIAIFYSTGIEPAALAVAGLLVAVIFLLRRAQVGWAPLHVALGVALWLATYESGVHATIAGVVLGLLTPARPLAPNVLAREWVTDLVEDPSPHDVTTLIGVARASLSTAERLEHQLLPMTSFVIVPVFALANAGVALEGGVTGAPGATGVTLGVLLGLLVGKPVGVSLFTWLAVRARLAALPPGVTWTQVLGLGALAGIGFTVALFVTNLSFRAAPELESAGKAGILLASLLAAVLGSAALLLACRKGATPVSATSPGESRSPR